MPQPRCIPDLIRVHVERRPDAVAITAPGRCPLTYAALFAHVNAVATQLSSMGVGRTTRVALVLPDGPEMVAAFLAIATAAASAPLNPAYRATEFDVLLSDLGANALIVQSGFETPARAAAETRGIPIIELSPRVGEEAGLFTLTGPRGVEHADGDGPADQDVALLLHTSGTTSRPKLVPLTHLNLCASACNVRAALDLVDSDRCLNVMPLFHIHGLVGAVLSSIAAGGSVCCTPGFHAPHFFQWMNEYKPTWYTAVPTMHQAILTRAAANPDIVTRSSLRFVRSSSSALPGTVMKELEAVFKVPVIESYGMTEASHQMTSNPFPARTRKPGSVGVAAGPDVAISDEGGRLLPAGTIGEVAIRGANVMNGYSGNPAANAAAFTEGWFRTGDQGYFDTDGYLFLTGRLKELINRGGEKISPAEIEQVLLYHPAPAQAVVFAVPHPTLGEEVAAAIVLRPGMTTTARTIREFAARTLTDFKVPRHVLFLKEIPKGPTGKLQRIGLAAKLGLTPRDSQQIASVRPFEPPRSPLEETLVDIWEQVLGTPRIGIHDDFIELGGDSILGTQLVARVRDVFEFEYSIIDLFDMPTVAGMAQVLEGFLNDTESV